MRFHGRAQETTEKIIQAFQDGTVPQPLAQVFIKREGLPMSNWSTSNQFLCCLSGCTDARGFRQWEAAGRKIIKGSSARAYILVPLVGKEEDDSGNESKYIYGFRTSAVFDVSQTEGEPLEYAEEERQFIDGLPLIEVARKLGLDVSTFDARQVGSLGFFSRNQKRIGLGVENLSTWLHELMHAADHALGNLNEERQHWRSECVAELGGATLGIMLGQEEAADVGGAWEYVSRYAEKAEIKPITACMQVLDRIAQAISLILEMADEVDAGETAVSGIVDTIHNSTSAEGGA